jgi:hypothetical protein
MHWFEQVCLYESITESEAHMTEQQKIMNLNLTVQSNCKLATVDTTFKSMLSMDKSKTPMLEQFKDLLLSAVVTYDRAHASKGGRSGSKANEFDIDTPLYKVLHAKTTQNGYLEAYQSETTGHRLDLL